MQIDFRRGKQRDYLFVGISQLCRGIDYAIERISSLMTSAPGPQAQSAFYVERRWIVRSMCESPLDAIHAAKELAEEDSFHYGCSFALSRSSVPMACLRCTATDISEEEIYAASLRHWFCSGGATGSHPFSCPVHYTLACARWKIHISRVDPLFQCCSCLVCSSAGKRPGMYSASDTSHSLQRSVMGGHD